MDAQQNTASFNEESIDRKVMWGEFELFWSGFLTTKGVNSQKYTPGSECTKLRMFDDMYIKCLHTNAWFMSAGSPEDIYEAYKLDECYCLTCCEGSAFCDIYVQEDFCTCNEGCSMTDDYNCCNNQTSACHAEVIKPW